MTIDMIHHHVQMGVGGQETKTTIETYQLHRPLPHRLQERLLRNLLGHIIQEKMMIVVTMRQRLQDTIIEMILEAAEVLQTVVAGFGVTEGHLRHRREAVVAAALIQAHLVAEARQVAVLAAVAVRQAGGEKTKNSQI